MTAGKRSPPDDRVVIRPTKRRRKRTLTPTVERIVPPRPPTWRETGELRLDELEDSGVFRLEGPSAEHEIAPVVAQQQRRPRTPLERALRISTMTLVALALLAFFGPAILGAARRALTGAPDDRWRAVPLSVGSDPSGARVFVEDQPRGVTPYLTRERCRGRTVHLRVELAGHNIWQWSGFCSADGVKVRADLQRSSR